MKDEMLYLNIKNNRLKTHRGTLYAIIILSCTLYVNVKSVNAEEFFNPSLLSDNAGNVADLSRFEKGEGQAEGVYRVDIYINNNFIGTRDVPFSASLSSVQDDTGLSPCLTKAWLIKQGVNITDKTYNINNDSCFNLLLLEKASFRFEFDKQKLYLSIPQALLVNNARGYISPELWDDGISALLLNYQVSASNYKNTHSGKKSNNYFVNLNSGLNLGAWRLRNNSTWNITESNGKKYQKWKSISNYIERAIIPLKSNFKFGDSSTNNDLFDSVGFRGLQLSSDENMLPESQRGFAPIVRGIANSNAQITIEQNGYVIYRKSVPPGPFEISDLYSTSNSGDLTVIVKENNGSINRFTVPYSSVPLLQREGAFKYSLTAGELHSGSSIQNKPNFIQGLFFIGLKQGVTFYQGFQYSSRYQSISAGIGKNLGSFGAFSADIIHANSKLADGSTHSGQSLRFLYAKSLNELGTNFQLLGYRYSTKGFYSLAESSYKNMKGYRLNTQDGYEDIEPTYIDNYNLYETKKGRLQANISQKLGDYGSLYLLGSYQTYWNTNKKKKLLQLGYNNSWDGITYNVSFSLNKDPESKKSDKRAALTVSIPLNKWFLGGAKGQDITYSNNAAYATYLSTYDSNHQATQQIGVNGTLLSRNNLNYSVQQGYGNKGQDLYGTISADYKGGTGNLNVGYNYGKHWQQVNYGVDGGLVIHSDGITFSQPLSETNVLVKAPGASGVGLENATGVTTNWLGYTIMPYATTYRNNRVALNVDMLKDNVDVEDAVVNVVPTKGALVKAEFNTHIGLRALISIKQKNGNPVPFGSIVSYEGNKNSGIVGDDGQVFLSGLAASGQLAIVWGRNSHEKCIADYNLSLNEQNTPLIHANSVCK